ncbi:ABC transporter permease [Nocardia sp. 348MFTsu5.1]|uniref:ABC transporter permease n=1 Tax=Nocardia sp. 348MFTsu5.1 TaxID=1172185 RepID=UPI0003633E96|nr:FtsX-like permease family protein [Nocardia sp. 348MFTsu5.1]
MASNTMRKVSLRNLAAHKLRLVLTVLSVVLGTAFVAGSMIFTATISSAFDGIFDKVALGVDTQVSPEDSNSSGVPDSVLTQLENNKTELGIAKILPTYSGPTTIAKENGKALQTGGAPSIGSAFQPPDERLSDTESNLIEGRAPETANEVALNESSADEAGLEVGSITKVATTRGSGAPMEVTVVGILDVPGATSGFTNVQFLESTAQKLFTDGSHSQSIDLQAVPGVSPEELKSRVAGLIGDDYKLRTGDEVRQDEKDNVNQFLDVFNYILLAFAAIGLIVGTFIIYNTFSMIVAQRVRELALLRAIGASRKQVTRSVLLEAFVVGLFGALVGLAAGIGIAALLRALTASSGLPSTSLQVGASSIIACLVVGIGVTMVSAYAPARRASKVSPVEAMRESATDGQASLKVRTIIGIVLGAIAIVLLAIGTSGEGGRAAGIVGLGALVMIFAVVFASPALSRPVVGVLGAALARPFGKIGQLARTNAVRNPRRTAATAFALTLGLMLVAVIGTLGSTFKGTIDDAIDTGLTANLIISGQQGSGFSPLVGQSVDDVDGVESVVSFGGVLAEVDGSGVQGYSPSGDMYSVTPYEMVEGSRTIDPDGIIVSERTSAEKGWKMGEVVEFTSYDGTVVPVTVTGVFKNNPLIDPWAMGSSAYQKLIPEALRQDVFAAVKTVPGADVQAVSDRIEDVTSDYLTVKVQTPSEFKGQQSSQIDQMLSVLYAMLGLALVIAVLGIVNTLALSVIERKREIGMLRAIGMARAQVRRTIYIESLLIAIFGAVLGVVLGVAFGWALVRTLRYWGLGDPVLPTGLIIITLIGAALVGVAAALWPASRAAKTKPLEAIAE